MKFYYYLKFKLMYLLIFNIKMYMMKFKFCIKKMNCSSYNIKCMPSFILMMTLSWFTLYFNNFFIVWMMTEIVTMIAIYLLIMEKDKYPALFYFLISVASSLMLYFNMVLYNSNDFIEEELFFLHNNMILFSLFLKSGLYPFNHWYMMCAKKMCWMNLFIFSTILKIQPLYLMYLLMDLNELIIYLILMNLMLSSILMFNTVCLKLLMVYSSLIQTSLMLLMIMFSMNLFVYYMSMYMFMSLMLYMLFGMFNLNNKFDIYNLQLSKECKYLFMLIMLMYSSLPPMFSFSIKWILLKYLVIYFDNFLFLPFITLLVSIKLVWIYMNLFIDNIAYLNSGIKSYSYKTVKDLNNHWLFFIFFAFLISNVFMVPMYTYFDDMNF